MSYFEYTQTKLSPYKIEGQSKPFVDKNLQLQLPEWELSPSSFFHHPLYSYYVPSILSPPLFPEINEAELCQAMISADRSYEAWKKMQQELQNIMQSKN